MYYLDIILAIYFVIGHRPFALHMAYALVRHYSTDNSDNNDINEDKWIYGEMHMADW